MKSTKTSVSVPSACRSHPIPWETSATMLMSTPVPRRLNNTNLSLDAPTSCATTTTVELEHRNQDTSTTQTPAEQAKEVLDSTSPGQGEATVSAQAPSKGSSARSTENALEQQAKPAIVHGAALLYLHTSSLHA
jgi:hypothetical protein